MTDLITHRIEFPSKGATIPGYLAHPTYAGPHRGVVLLQEWWGLVPHMEEVARRFARSGFVALAPDLYHGKKAEEPDEAKKLAAALNRDRAIQEIIAAGQYLKSMDQVAPKWLGLVGWGLGGELALSTTVFSADFAAVVAFYGRPPGPFDIPRIQAPILGIYAEVDVGIAAEDVREFERQLEQYRLPHDITIYPDTQHAFFNDAQPATYHDAAMHESWDRTLTWLRQHLG